MVHMNEMQEPFEFPPDLSKLSREEREELHRKYLRHCSTTEDWDTVDGSPSQVVDVNSDEYQETLAAKKAAQQAELEAIQESLNDEVESAKSSSPHEFVEGVGYVVGPGEDIHSLAGRLSPEAYDEMLKREAKTRKVVAPPRPPEEPPEGDSGDRFENLWI
jgi:hypothetical protein